MSLERLYPQPLISNYHPFRLRGIDLEHFKSVDQANVDLSPLSVVVGANSSGKSTLSSRYWLSARQLGPPADRPRTCSSMVTSYSLKLIVKFRTFELISLKRGLLTEW